MAKSTSKDLKPNFSLKMAIHFKFLCAGLGDLSRGQGALLRLSGHSGTRQIDQEKSDLPLICLRFLIFIIAFQVELKFEQWVPNDMLELYKKCHSFEPQNRPSFEQIRDRIAEVRDFFYEEYWTFEVIISLDSFGLSETRFS